MELITEKLLTLEEACSHLKMEISYMNQLVLKKKIPCYKTEKGTIYFFISELDKWKLDNHQNYEVNK